VHESLSIAGASPYGIRENARRCRTVCLAGCRRQRSSSGRPEKLAGQASDADNALGIGSIFRHNCRRDAMLFTV
jgi:hypothetical protein